MVSFFYGRSPWDGPKSVYDMLNLSEKQKIKFSGILPDYRMNLIDASHMTQDIVAYYRETWYALSIIKNDVRYREFIDQVSDEELTGGVSMCATLDRIENEGKEIGKEIGIELAIMLINEGRTEDLLRAAKDSNYQKQLFEEFGLNN